MSHYEVLHESQDLPSGFESYSLLLVPDNTWPLQVGAAKMFDLVSRFKAFGDTLGPAHLASWPYHGLQQQSPHRVVYEVCSLVFSFAGSEDDLQEFITKRSDLLSTKESLEGCYHLSRARQLCALYGLDFNSGPYIAFFEGKPHVPTTWSRHNPWPEPEDPKTPSQPDFVLKFGGRSYDEAIHLLNSLEFELLRGSKKFTSIKLLQIRLSLSKICRRLVAQAKTSLEIIKSAKDIYS